MCGRFAFCRYAIVAAGAAANYLPVVDSNNRVECAGRVAGIARVGRRWVSGGLPFGGNAIVAG